ncbi:MAG: TonB-dependent receptor [Bacteroidales bacterium]
MSLPLFAQQAGRIPRITISVSDVPFTDFAREVEQLSGMHVFFSTEWTRDVRVNLSVKDCPADSVIMRALPPSNLRVVLWNGALLMMQGENLLSRLPHYDTETTITENADGISAEETEAEERYLSGRKPGVLESITIGEISARKNGTPVRIKGRINEKETGEPLPGATMYIQETGAGTVSDVAGNLFISLKPGIYTAQFECLGMEKKMIQFQVFSEGSFSLEIGKSVIPIQEIVVKGGVRKNITVSDPGMEKINIKSVKELPVMLGDRDILKISEMLPGIVSVGEGSAGLNVRGGSADQNMFYINKVPVYNTSHLFGFFSAFNSDIIKDFSIYKGHVPAQYGGRLSSVFNIITRQGNRRQFMARGGVNPVTANLSIEAPIKKDACTMMLSARSSYSDWILGRLDDPLIRNSRASFYDLTGSITWDMSSKDQVSLFYYGSSDNFKLSDINSYGYTNNGSSLNWRHQYSNYFKGEIALISSEYSFTTSDTKSKSIAYQHTYKIGHYEARADFSWRTGTRNTIETGVGSIFYNLNRGEVKPYNEESLRIPVNLGEEKGIESSAYLADTWDPFRWLSANIGIRYVFFAPVGPRDVYLYNPALPMLADNITDTLKYGTNEPVRKYSGPEIRAALNFKLTRSTSLKLSFNQMQQYMFMLSNTIALAPNSQWKLADYYLKPSRSNQASAGIFQEIASKGWEISAEVFAKETEFYTEFKDGADFIASPLVETSVLQGNQSAYGIEAMIRKEGGKLDGWLAYTWSRSIVTVKGRKVWDQINEGKPYPANFDIPHAFTAVGSYHFTRRFTLASNITYQTGRPITYPKSIYLINGISYLDYSTRNEYRIPDYFRIDLSLTVEGNLVKKKKVHSSWMVNVYNLTGRKNAYSVFFDAKEGVILGNKYSVIGIPLVMATWQFKFGNYAAD